MIDLYFIRIYFLHFLIFYNYIVSNILLQELERGTLASWRTESPQTPMEILRWAEGISWEMWKSPRKIDHSPFSQAWYHVQKWLPQKEHIASSKANTSTHLSMSHNSEKTLFQNFSQVITNFFRASFNLERVIQSKQIFIRILQR